MQLDGIFDYQYYRFICWDKYHPIKYFSTSILGVVPVRVPEGRNRVMKLVRKCFPLFLVVVF